MNNSKLKIIVAEAVVLDRQKSEIEKRLKNYKQQLILEAQSREEEHVPTEGGGSSIRFEGADGCVAVVCFPARKLKSKIDAEGKVFDKVKTMLGNQVNRLFVPSVVYVPCEYFRDQAENILGRPDAGKLIKLCETESSPSVSFETADKQTES